MLFMFKVFLQKITPPFPDEVPYFNIFFTSISFYRKGWFEFHSLFLIVNRNLLLSRLSGRSVYSVIYLTRLSRNIQLQTVLLSEYLQSHLRLHFWSLNTSKSSSIVTFPEDKTVFKRSKNEITMMHFFLAIPSKPVYFKAFLYSLVPHLDINTTVSTSGS